MATVTVLELPVVVMLTIVSTEPLCVTVCVFEDPVTAAVRLCPPPALEPFIVLVNVLKSPRMVMLLVLLLVSMVCVTVLESPVMLSVLVMLLPLMVLVTVLRSPEMVIVLVTEVQAVVPSPQTKVIWLVSPVTVLEIVLELPTTV